MKKQIITTTLFLILLSSACQKDDLAQPNTSPKPNLINCRSCGADWDFTEVP